MLMVVELELCLILGLLLHLTQYLLELLSLQLRLMWLLPMSRELKKLCYMFLLESTSLTSIQKTQWSIVGYYWALWLSWKLVPKGRKDKWWQTFIAKLLLGR